MLDKTPKLVQTVVVPEGPAAAAVRIVRLADDGKSYPEFVTHAVGRIEAPADNKLQTVDLDSIRARFTGDARDTAWRKEALGKSGLEPGPTFSWLVLHWTNPQDALGQMRPPCDADRAGQYHVHPGLLDSALQLLGSILPGAGTGIDAYVPMAFHRLQCFAIPPQPLWALATLTSFDGKVASGNVDLFDEQGQVVLQLERASLRRVSRDWIARLAAGPLPDWCYELAWINQPLGGEAGDNRTEAGRWLIFDSREGAGEALAERFRMKAHECTVIPAGVSPEARRTAIGEFLSIQAPEPLGVVCLASLDAKSAAEGPDFAAARQDGWGAALDLVHALTNSGKAKPPRLWLVTRGGHAAGGESQLTLAQSPAWGLGRVVAAEHPELKCARIDLDPSQSRDEADQLAEEILFGQTEDQVAYRGGEPPCGAIAPPGPRRCRHIATSPRPPVPVGNHFARPIGQRGLATGLRANLRWPARWKSKSTPPD